MIVRVGGDGRSDNDPRSGLGDLAVIRPRGASRRELASGDAGVLQTLAEMFRLSDEALLDPVVRKFTDAALARTPAQEENRQLQRLTGAWLRHLAVRNDPEGVEMLMHPRLILERGAGDCDDMTLGLMTSLRQVGFGVELVVVQQPKRRSFNHVYLRVKSRQTGRWIPVDPRAIAEQGVGIGWELPDHAWVRRAAYGWDTKRKRLKLGESGP